LLPTYAQLLALARICQTLSDFYCLIVLCRFDTTRQVFYLLAEKQDILEILIDSEGKVEVIDD
jgi:hypothetical protein